MKHFTITHLLYAVGATALTRAALNYYMVSTENPLISLLAYVLIIPPVVVFILNRNSIVSGRKAHAQTAMIAVVLSILFGVIQNFI